MRKLHTFRSIITGETHTKELSDVELRYYLRSFWNLRLVSAGASDAPRMSAGASNLRLVSEA